jgi:hypothetical protein
MHDGIIPSPRGISVKGRAVMYVSLLAAVSAADAFEFPKRKSGLWEIETITSTGAAGSGKAQLCVDPKTDTLLNDMGGGMMDKLCSKNEARREGSTIVSDSVCQFGDSTVTTHSVITGKFETQYEVNTRSTYNPPLNGLTEGSAVIRARWLGSCKAGQKPGDMILPSGAKININDQPKP